MLKRFRVAFLLVALFLVGISFNKKIIYASPMSVFSNNSLDKEEKSLYNNEWVKIDGFYFYYSFDGEKVKDNWINDVNDWYHVDKEGKMQISTWINDANNDWYYVGEDGKMQRSKWIENKYFVDENGKMLKNAAYQIGGKAYAFDGNGVGTEIPPETTAAKSYSNNHSNGSRSGGNSGSDTTVYVSGKGKKYHSRPGCSNMKSPTAISKSQAISSGYSACSKCW